MPWQCEVCTLINSDDDRMECNLCGKLKGTKDPLAGDEKAKHMSLKAILKAGPEAFDTEIQEKRRLEELKKIKGVFGIILNTETPVVVCDCIAYLRARGLYTEGVFRVPGQQDIVDAVKERYSMEKDEDVLNLIPCEVHDVATLLKAYFRWLPQPIVPEENYHKVLNACRENSHKSKDELEEAVFDAIADLQSPNRECLSLLMQFLREVTQFSSINKMTSTNLATVFAPSVLRSPDSVTAEQAFLDLGSAISVINILIRSNRELYLPPKEQVIKATKHKPKGVVPPPPGLDKRRSSKKKKTTSLSKKASELLRRVSRPKSGHGPPGLSHPKQPPPMPSRPNDNGPTIKEKVAEKARTKGVPKPDIDIDNAI